MTSPLLTCFTFKPPSFKDLTYSRSSVDGNSHWCGNQLRETVAWGSQEVWGCPASLVKVLHWPYLWNEEKDPCYTYAYRIFWVRKDKGLPPVADLGRDSTPVRGYSGIRNKAFSTLLGPHLSSGCQHVRLLFLLSSLSSLSLFRFSLSSIGLCVVLGL